MEVNESLLCTVTQLKRTSKRRKILCCFGKLNRSEITVRLYGKQLKSTLAFAGVLLPTAAADALVNKSNDKLVSSPTQE